MSVISVLDLNESYRGFIPTYKWMRANCRQSRTIFAEGPDGLFSSGYTFLTLKGVIPGISFDIMTYMEYPLFHVFIVDDSDDDSGYHWAVSAGIGRNKSYSNMNLTKKEAVRAFDGIIREIYSRGAYSPEYDTDLAKQKINKIVPKICSKYGLSRNKHI